ncbi:MAG: hypothetical protein U1C73_12585, partial [Dietzia sp.]|nr:hypothetical protein [Dietzia sp.]
HHAGDREPHQQQGDAHGHLHRASTYRRGASTAAHAVAAVGGGIWMANVSQQTGPATLATPVAQSTSTTAAPPPPSPPPAVPFPAKANYVGSIPTAAGIITLEVTIDGQNAVAYACDDNAVEVWLRGSATNGALALENSDRTSRLTGGLEGASIAGTLTIGARSWAFTAAPAEVPAEPYVDVAAGGDDAY